ncbi:MAG: DASS family sodium-coupled anion symporter [Bacteroidota bacterium]
MQKSTSYPIIKKVGLLLGPLVFILLYNFPFELINAAADKVIAVAAWMVIWWITETVSISVTALIPLTVFPLLKIADIKTVAASYGSPIVFLFFGGFVMALALEKVNLHKRIALNIIKFTGLSPDRVILGFLIATAFLSMWISNTATTVVMLPIALSVITLLANDEDGFTKGDQNFALSLLLGVAFAANVGGIATIIGTPPNTVLIGFLEQEYGIQISFLSWLKVGLPFSLLMLTLIYFILVKLIYPNHLKSESNNFDLINNELRKLGPINKIEKRVLLIFATTILLWIGRTSINVWMPFISLSDAGISMLAAFFLFTIPLQFQTGKFSLEWEDTQKLPWGILILFGGGLALASALSSTGVIDFIGNIISKKENLSVFLIGAILIAVVLFMTELMSNVALIAIFAPVIAGIAIGLKSEMLYMLIPAAMASSCAFMLPMATPPNAIVFASGHIKVHEMVKAGVYLNILAVLILIIFSYTLIPLCF